MNVKSLIASASFEERSLYWIENLINIEIEPKNIYVANVNEIGKEPQNNINSFSQLGVKSIVSIDRFSSSELWSWAIDVVDQACSTQELLIDVTCMHRELLGMLLFIVSTKMEFFDKISVLYVSSPEGGYATLNDELLETDRWLSKGVQCVRTIVGYPGSFQSEKGCHLIVLAGHETERVLKIIEDTEPRRLTISGELANSSIVPGASKISQEVVNELKSKIQIPEIQTIPFSSSSIDSVFLSLAEQKLDGLKENIVLAAMNTKLVFVGAALFALSNRSIRLIYAVPREYNPLYCKGQGKAYRHDITKMIDNTKTYIDQWVYH